MVRVQLPNSWQPRAHQKRLWSYLEDGGKRAAAVWHRRAGKDSVCLNWGAVAAHQRVANYWHMLPEAAQARKAVWEAVSPHTGVRLIDQAFPLALRDTTRENEMLIRFKNGSTWQVVGSDNYQSLIGSTPAGVVFSEWSLADPASWTFLRPILAENNGWALFIYTARGRNHGWNTLQQARTEPNWFGEVLTAEDTGIFTEEQLAQELRELQSENGEDDGKALYEQEYFCSFTAAVMGSYYGKLMDKADKDGRTGVVPHDPTKQVETWWDIGVGDSTAIWFIQRVGLEIRAIDYHEATGEGLPEYIKVLREKPYVYSRHIAPHDIRVREWLVGNGKTRLDVAKELGLDFIVAPQMPVDDGIALCRALIPRMSFDAKNCKRGLDALRNYRKSWDDKLKTFRSYPLHDWSSHGADAFRTGAVAPDPAGKSKSLKYGKLPIV